MLVASPLDSTADSDVVPPSESDAGDHTLVKASCFVSLRKLAQKTLGSSHTVRNLRCLRGGHLRFYLYTVEDTFHIYHKELATRTLARTVGAAA